MHNVSLSAYTISLYMKSVQCNLRHVIFVYKFGNPSNVFIYKCSGTYNPSEEYTIKWDDPDIGIKWNIKNPVVSKKDQQGLSLKKYKDSKLINA